MNTLNDETVNATLEQIIPHLENKASSRLSDVQILHSKANFILMTNGIILPLLFNKDTHFVCFVLMALGIMSSVILAVFAVHLRVPTHISDSHYLISIVKNGRTRKAISDYLCRAYADTFNLFNQEYDKKYSYLKLSFGALVITIFVLLLSGGYEIYG